MSRDDPHFRLRLPAELKETIRKTAERNQRSVTGQIVFMLREAVEQSPKTASGGEPA